MQYFIFHIFLILDNGYFHSKSVFWYDYIFISTGIGYDISIEN